MPKIVDHEKRRSELAEVASARFGWWTATWSGWGAESKTGHQYRGRNKYSPHGFDIMPPIGRRGRGIEAIQVVERSTSWQRQLPRGARHGEGAGVQSSIRPNLGCDLACSSAALAANPFGLLLSWLLRRDALADVGKVRNRAPLYSIATREGVGCKLIPQHSIEIDGGLQRPDTRFCERPWAAHQRSTMREALAPAPEERPRKRSLQTVPRGRSSWTRSATRSRTDSRSTGDPDQGTVLSPSRGLR